MASQDFTIRDIERIVLNVPFHPRCARIKELRVPGWTMVELTRVTTAAGVTGVGETIENYTWGRSREAQHQKVMGKNLFDFLWDDSLGAGLQMALFDAAGRQLGVPCHRLLGPLHREACPVSWWAQDMKPEEWAAEARAAEEHGFTTMKVKARPWWDIDQQLAAVGAAVSPHFQLDVDFNGLLLGEDVAAPLIGRLEQTYRNLAIVESPIPQSDVAGNVALRRKIRSPIAMHLGTPPVMTAIREGVCDGFVIGGGITNVLRQGALAAEFDKPFFLQIVGTGITTALSLQLGAVLSHAQWPAVNCMNIYDEDMLATPLTIRGGYAQTPDGPGLGIEVDEEALVRLRMEPPYEHPPLRLLLALVWPDGRKRYYANIGQCWKDAQNGNMPIHEAGARLEYVENDGSSDWDELQVRAESEGPVFSTM